MKSVFRNTIISCIVLLVNYLQVGAIEVSGHEEGCTVPKENSEWIVELKNSEWIVELIECATVELYCSTIVNPSTSGILWKFNGEHVDGSLSVLTINISSFSQSGNYSCGFANESKELWENVSITIGRKPPPVRNLTCVEIHNNTDNDPEYRGYFNCTWLPGEVETNLNTDYYQVRHGGHSVEVVTDLYKVYKFSKKEQIKVKAHNQLGYSERKITLFNIEVIAPEVSGQLNDTALFVNWTIPPKDQNNPYILRYREVFPVVHNWTDKDCNRKEKPQTIGVKPGYKEYEVKVAIKHEQAKSETWSDTVTFRKKETKPTGTVDGDCKWQDDNLITCNWVELCKEYQNGRLLGYNVFVFYAENYKKVKNATIKHCNALLATPEHCKETTQHCNASFEGLSSNKDYVVNITAYNSAGYTTILNSRVLGELRSSVGPSYVALIVCVSIVLLFLIIAIVVRCIKKADFMKPLPDPKYYHKREWETPGCAERLYPAVEVEYFDPPKEKGDLSERTFMLPEGCLEEDVQQKQPATEVTNLTYLIMGRKQEQQNNNICHVDLNAENLQKIDSEENKDDAKVCYLSLNNGNLLTQVQTHDDASRVTSEELSLSADPLPVAAGPVPYSEEGYESFMTNRSTVSSENYISGSGISCRTADTQLSSSSEK